MLLVSASTCNIKSSPSSIFTIYLASTFSSTYSFTICLISTCSPSPLFYRLRELNLLPNLHFLLIPDLLFPHLTDFHLPTLCFHLLSDVQIHLHLFHCPLYLHLHPR